jgi:integrase
MASIRKRTRLDGVEYYAVLHRIDGKQTSDSFSEPAKAEAFKRLVELYGGAKARELDATEDQAQRLHEYLAEYIEGLTGVEQAARDRYTRFLERDIKGHPIAEMPLSAITEQNVGDWVNTIASTLWRGKPPAAKTVANKHGFLAGALKAAHRRGLIPTNPTEHTRLPRGQKQEMVFLTPAEFGTVRDTLAEPWRPLAVWLVSTGMRFSEATALTVGDIDRDTRSVRISKAWKYASSTKAQPLGSTKTKKGVRTITAPAEAITLLDLDRAPDSLLFVNASGERVKQKMFYEPWERARSKSYDVTRKKPRVHDLRHTCASWLLGAGVPIPVVQYHLGHESIQTTVDRYGHLDQSAAQQAADAISAALR